MMVIDESGQNIGLLSKKEALNLAQKKNLDLIEVSPLSKPPVARIISFDKYRYQQEKKLKKQRTSQKINTWKRIQISARAAKNDLEIKAKKANQFLDEGHPLEIVLVLHGREKYNRDWAMGKLKEFLLFIYPQHKILTPPKFFGRGIIMQIVKG